MRGVPTEIRKLLALWVLLITNYCLLITDSCAAPCYGPRMPQKKEVFLGFQSHTIFKRYLEHEAGSLRSQQEFFLLSVGVLDWLSLDLKGGAGYIKQHPLGADELDYPTFLGGGYGLRLKLYDRKKIKWIFGFQHISIHPASIHIGLTKHKAVLDDWQFLTLLAYDFKKFTPYVGTKWSRGDYIHWVDGERDLVKSDLTKSVGLVLGVDLPLTKRTWLNLEGQFIDSSAVAFSLNYSF